MTQPSDDRLPSGRAGRFARRGVALTSVVAVLAFGIATEARGDSDSSSDGTVAPGLLTSFDATAVGGIVDFQLIYPDVLPYRIVGGVLESSSQASGTGNAQSVAGPVPIPLLLQASEVFPTNDPITGQPVPDDVRKGWQSVDWQSMPNQCKSEYPDVIGKGNDDVYCGGPASDSPEMGFTAAFLNGHAKSSGRSDDPLSAQAESISRGVDIFVPAVQMKIRGARAEAVAGLNATGIPQALSAVEMDNVAIFGGLIELAGLRSEATSQSDGTETGARSATSFNIREASVAGIPVVIGRDGVSVREQALVPGTSIQDAAKTVSSALKAADVQIHLLPPPQPSQLGSQTSVWGAGLEIVHRGESVRRSDSFYRFGYVAASVSATRESAEAVDSPTGQAAPLLPAAPQESSGSDGPGRAFGNAEVAAPPTEVSALTSNERAGFRESAAGWNIPAGAANSGAMYVAGGTPATYASPPNFRPSSDQTVSSPQSPAVHLAERAALTVPVAQNALPVGRVRGLSGAFLALTILGAVGLMLRRVLL